MAVRELNACAKRNPRSIIHYLIRRGARRRSLLSQLSPGEPVSPIPAKEPQLS